MSDLPSSSDEEQPSEPVELPPSVIVGLPEPELTVGRVIGPMSEDQARRNSVAISCGLSFAARRSEFDALNHRLRKPDPERPQSDAERLGAPSQSRHSDAPVARVEVCVKVGVELVIVCPWSGAHGVCLAGQACCANG